jgi:N6-adenosine-specific RNA methylase IME4
MPPAQWRDFVAQVARDGRILEPLVVVGDEVVDGRHRLHAARELGFETIPTKPLQLAPGETIETFVYRAALARRHLNDDQRAILAAKYATSLPDGRGGDRRSPEAGIKGADVRPIDHPGREAAAAQFAVSRSQVKQARQLLNVDAALAARVFNGEVKLSKALNQKQHEQQLALVELTPPPKGVYRTIVIDPPWQYENAGFRSAAARKYPTMSLAELKALPVPKLADPSGAHVYLWVTNPMLREGFALLEAWGLKYKTMLTWHKEKGGKPGLGHYFRGETEHVLFAVRGTLPLLKNNVSNFIWTEAGAHSVKPVAFFDRVKLVSPGPQIEMFARCKRAGWHRWGAEAPNGPETDIIGSTAEVKREDEP